jgi:NADPH:quinone reductase-like Zn-dependent oxidoreductase
MAAGQGARVTATAGGRDKDFVTNLGAHEVIDYANERFEDHVDGVDVILDMVGGETQARSWSVIRPGGVLVSIFAPPDAQQAAAHGARTVFFIVEPNRAQLQSIARLIEAGRLTPAVDRVVSLADTRAAYEALQTEHRRDKVVIHVAER